MKLKIRKSALVQYMLIYLMLLIPGSCFFQVYLGVNKYYIFTALYILLCVFNKKMFKGYGIRYTAILLVAIMMLRIIVGGVGLFSWMQIALCVLSTQCAIAYDSTNFLRRWIKVVVFLAVISIVMWGIFLLMPQLVEWWIAPKYFVQSIGVDQWANDYYGKGLLYYSYLEAHPTRNCGIFSEPGVYQVVLNSALFFMLFWKKRLQFKNQRQFITQLTIIIIALISCQSTTGYIALVIMLLFYFILYRGNGSEKQSTKKHLLTIISLAVVVLVLDYYGKGTNSIFYQQIIQKLFPSGDQLDFSMGTGMYRMGMILYALDVIVKNPFGVGYDVFSAGLTRGDVGASLVSFAAIYGVIPWIITIGFVFYPIFKYEKKTIAFMLMLIFVNTTLAQTDLLYTSFLIIPLYLMIEKNKGKIANKTGRI